MYKWMFLCYFNWMEMDVQTDNRMKTETLRITPEFLQLIAALDEFKGAWAAFGRIAPERLLSLRRVATIESIGSSTRIEGSRLIDVEVERLLSNLEITEFATRDEQEVAGYAEAMELVFDSWAEIDLTENHIKHLHQVLLRHSSKDQRHRGSYKTLDNHAEAYGPNGESLGVVFSTATPFETPRLMEELLGWNACATGVRRTSSAGCDLHIHCGVLANPSIPGRQRPPVPHSHPPCCFCGPVTRMRHTARWKA